MNSSPRLGLFMSIFVFHTPLFMKKFIPAILAVTIPAFFAMAALIGCNDTMQKKLATPTINADTVFAQPVSKWFNAWELISRDVFYVDSLRPVDFIFFDDQYVYTTAVITAPTGQEVTGPTMFGKDYKWRRALHSDSILLPDHRVVPIGLMSFAAPAGENGSYFVMPLPAFWKQANVKSEELGLDNLVTGVFLHEFSHSQQMQNFGKKISWYEKNTSFGIDFNDDIVQELMSSDSQFVQQYKDEVSNLFQAAVVEEDSIAKMLLRQGLASMNLRAEKFYTGKFTELKEIEAFFLTMEGIGQYAMYAWLQHPKGAHLAKEKVLKGVRRGGRSWSQDEGLSLFLLLARFAPASGWAPPMFNESTQSVIEQLKQIAGAK